MRNLFKQITTERYYNNEQLNRIKNALKPDNSTSSPPFTGITCQVFR